MPELESILTRFNSNPSANDAWTIAGEAYNAATAGGSAGGAAIVDSEVALFRKYAASMPADVKAFLEGEIGKSLTAIAQKPDPWTDVTPSQQSGLKAILERLAYNDGKIDALEAADIYNEAAFDADGLTDADKMMIQSYSSKITKPAANLFALNGLQVVAGHSGGVSTGGANQSPNTGNTGSISGSRLAGEAARDATEDLAETLNARYKNFGAGYHYFDLWSWQWKNRESYDFDTLWRYYDDPDYAPDAWEQILSDTPNFKGQGLVGFAGAIDYNRQSVANSLEAVRDALDMNPTRSQMQNAQQYLRELNRLPHKIRDGYWTWYNLESRSEVNEINRLIRAIDQLPRR